MVEEEQEVATTSEQDEEYYWAVLDTACTSTLHGEKWAQKLRVLLTQQGLEPKEEPVHVSVQGVGGESVEVTRAVIWPIAIAGKQGQIRSLELPESWTPLLLSRVAQEQLGTVLNLGSKVVDFVQLGVYQLPLFQTHRGHLAVSVVDFPAPDVAEGIAEGDVVSSVPLLAGKSSVQQVMMCVQCATDSLHVKVRPCECCARGVCVCVCVECAERSGPDWRCAKCSDEDGQEEVTTTSQVTALTPLSPLSVSPEIVTGELSPLLSDDLQHEVCDEQAWLCEPVRTGMLSRKRRKKLRSQIVLVHEAAGRSEHVLLSTQMYRTYPPKGRTFVKQLFSVMFALTMWCVQWSGTSTVSVGQPVELGEILNGQGKTVQRRIAEVKAQVGAEDPYLITWQCPDELVGLPVEDRLRVYRLLGDCTEEALNRGRY
eukprot:6492330-Amphidinium_carterae.2